MVAKRRSETSSHLDTQSDQTQIRNITRRQSTRLKTNDANSDQKEDVNMDLSTKNIKRKRQTLESEDNSDGNAQERASKRQKKVVASINPSRVSATNRTLKQKIKGKAKAVEYISEIDEVDDENDSDFVVSDDNKSATSKDSDEESEVSSNSSEELGASNRRMQLSRRTTVVRRGSSASTANERRIQRQTASVRTTRNEDPSTTEIEQEQPAIIRTAPEIYQEDDGYNGPRFFIEYAENNRTRCKSCEEKLAKGDLRIGVRVKHSMFGFTTYYKHVGCTNLCWGTHIPTTDSDRPDAQADHMNVIHGFARLSLHDQAFITTYMKNNSEIPGLLDERLPLDDEHYKKNSIKTKKERNPSPYLTATLLPYQKEALHWMVEQEKSEYKGGILADEMGMGKTIQAIALILENPRIIPTLKGKKNMKTTIQGGTLVICPLVAIMQWKSEIEKFTQANHLSIYIHHGSKRHTNAKDIAKYDIVLSTFSIVEAEKRKSSGWEKVKCQYCQRKYLPEKLPMHHKYFCGPKARKTKLQAKQKSKSKGGKNIDAKVDKNEKKGKKKKAAGESSDESIANYSDDEDIEIPYDTHVKKKQQDPPLHQIQWTRIILDEAHYIKDRNSNSARAIFQLLADFRWCLTGTPLQNRIGELFSLVRFLRVESFAYYHCKLCSCRLLDYNFRHGKNCLECGHNAMSHFSYFNKKIVIPIQSYGYVAEGKVAMMKLQNDLLQYILLRRTKEERAEDLSLPPKLVTVRKNCLDERENDFYQAIYTQSQAQFNTYVSSGTLLNNYAHIFDLLIRLRQAVDHPYLVIYSKSNPALQVPLIETSNTNSRLVKEEPLISPASGDIQYGISASGMKEGMKNEQDYQLCGVCHEEIEDPVQAQCTHTFCRECVKEYIESLPVGGIAKCPTCQKLLNVDLSQNASAVETVTNDETNEIPSEKSQMPTGTEKNMLQYIKSSFHKSSIMHRITDVASFQTSTKIEALMQELERMKRNDPSGKAIVFSQFVNMLDLMQHRLTIGGLKVVKLAGSMSMEARDRIIRSFREDATVSVFLISLKAGGVALNLTIASHIFLMDPWWNPAAENQAIDRTHRLGQFKPIKATRFIIANTIEERILQLQEKKRLIFEGTVGGSVSAICRLTEEDLRFLFSK